MIKEIGYRLFSIFYKIFTVFPQDPESVFLIATHDKSAEGNIGIVADKLAREMPEYKCTWLTRDNSYKNPIDYFLKKPYKLARSKYIFLDNAFLPLSYFKVRRGTKVVQLWHGTGAIKKFGQDYNTGKLGELERRANENITHLIVDSESVAVEYAGAFGVDDDKVMRIGLPRTDYVLDKDIMNKLKAQFYEAYGGLRQRKIVLYAPTFRDSEVDNPKINMDLQRISDLLGEEGVLLLRLHPLVAKNMPDEVKDNLPDNVFDMSLYPSVTGLLSVADILITDYSSIIYEYVLLERPIIFYAYDLEEFSRNGRSFYRDYETFVPGPIARNQDELEDNLKVCDNSKSKEFVQREIEHLDGKSTDRLFDLIFS
ncbi:MAG: CDP-glycerol glycerophosphotransferase family protein [Eubacterium sp.]|nr:CDP-glycerol glycerophosphotransferase family protein [Eubacterium sp.]